MLQMKLAICVCVSVDIELIGYSGALPGRPSQGAQGKVLVDGLTARACARWPERDIWQPTGNCASVPPMTKSRAMLRLSGIDCSKKLPATPEAWAGQAVGR